MKKNNLKFQIVSIVLIFLGMISFAHFVYADDTTTTTTDTTTGTSTDDGGNITTTTTDDGTGSDTATTTQTVAYENFIVRNGNTVLFTDAVPLPSAGMISINDKNGNAHSINSRSVLAVLNSIANSSNMFLISDLEYYDSYGSFYLKCITPQSGSEACDNWQYAVGSSTPTPGIDQTILSGGETVGIYFGSQHRVQFDTTTISAGGSVTATAQSYNYADNTWSPLSGVTIGLTVPNPNDTWNPTVVSSIHVSQDGTAQIAVANPGVYTAGIAEDYYFPSYTVTAIAAPVVNSFGDGAQLTATSSKLFSVPQALSYLQSVQATDGSFGESDMYTDWAGIAYGAGNVSGTSTDLLLSYLKSHATLSPNLTDNERRTMTLLSLGQNPYAFSGTNYIDAITKSFDGNQFGDSSLINDDIFALIPLSASGYTATDTMISKDISFVISKQNIDGSWNESVDMTSAAVQALEQFNSVAGVIDSISKAGIYLQHSQNADGGWGNISSSSWAIDAMNTLGDTWMKNGKSSSDYLLAQQVSDGAVLPNTETKQNRIWATSYAIPAGLGKPWSAIMHVVSKPEIVESVVVATSTKSIITSINNSVSNDLIVIPQNKSIQVSAKNSDIKNSVATSTATNTSSLSANVLQSTTTNSEKIPIVIGSIGGVALLGFFVRKFLGIL